MKTEKSSVTSRTSKCADEHSRHFSNRYLVLWNRQCWTREDLNTLADLLNNSKDHDRIFTATESTFLIALQRRAIDRWTFRSIVSFFSFDWTRDVGMTVIIRRSIFDAHSCDSFRFLCSSGGLVSCSSDSRARKISSSCWAINWLVVCFDWPANVDISFCNRGKVDWK